MSEWVNWEGGECPVHRSTWVDLILGNGDKAFNVLAGWVDWEGGHHSNDIVAYRLSSAQGSMEEAYEDTDRPVSDDPLNVQIGGDHYRQFEIQPVEFINANNMDFLQGSVIKYVSRHKLKGGKVDIEKAMHFCKLILELQYGGE